MKKIIKPTLIALSLAFTLPNAALASGIPTVDAAGIAVTIAENLKTLAQLKEQYDALQTQINEAKKFAQDTKNRLEGNWNLGEIIANDDFLRSLPQLAADSLLNSVQNISSLRSQYGLTSENQEVQATFDSLIRYAERTKTAYENTQKRIKNLTRLKTLADAAKTPAQKADIANQFAYEKLKFDQEQAAIKQLNESVKIQNELKGQKNRLDFQNALDKELEEYKRRNSF
ncbi:type IV secretion system protein [Histophilus somni]|uniref:type IV secretion system protein n=1 Tax=Histophilus somni TaxID=731 RepID=UPI00201EB466|nr:type IV secretion system protein [Histophilus somni]